MPTLPLAPVVSLCSFMTPSHLEAVNAGAARRVVSAELGGQQVGVCERHHDVGNAAACQGVGRCRDRGKETVRALNRGWLPGSCSRIFIEYFWEISREESSSPGLCVRPLHTYRGSQHTM